MLLFCLQSAPLFAAEIVERWVALDHWPDKLPSSDLLSQGCRGQLPAMTSTEWLHDPSSSRVAAHSLGVRASYHKATIKGRPGEKFVLSSSLPLVEKGFACFKTEDAEDFLVFESQKERRGYPSFTGTIGRNGELHVEVLLLAERPVSPLILVRTYRADIEEYASILYWVLIGGLTAVLLYNLFLWLGAKKRLYMINVCYISSILSLNFVFSFGFFATRNLWTQLGWGSADTLVRVLNALGNPSGLLASTCVIYFSIYYCDIPALSRKLARALWMAFVFGVTLSALGFVYIFITNDPGKMNSVSRYLGSANSIIILGTSAYAGFWRKRIFGRILFFSYLPLTLGTSIFVSYLEGRIFGDNIFARNSLLIGSFFESLFLSYSVGFRLKLTEDLAHSKTEELSARLLRMNEELEDKVTLATGEIRAILENIGEAIFTVDLDQHGEIRLAEQMSDHTWQLFPQLRPHSNPSFETFLDALQLSQEVRSNIKSLIIAAVGEDLLAFQLNEQLAPREVYGWGGQCLEMNIDTIMNADQKIQCLLISLKDISDRLEHERVRRLEEEQNLILLEMLESGLTRIGSHLFILKNTLCSGDDSLGKEQYLRQMHTAKGIARSWGFRLLSEKIHVIEEELIQNRMELAKARHETFQIYQNYANLYQLKLMRSQDSEQHDQERRCQALKEVLARIEAPASDEYKSRLSQLITDFMLGGEFVSEVLGSFQTEVDRLSEQMGRVPCRFEIAEDQVIRLSKEIKVVLIGILGHLIRNSLDHGMEDAAERMRIGKDPVGKLHFRILENSGSKLSFQFWDDGRGLHLASIQNKAGQLELGAMSEEKALELIFRNQFSSKDNVSLISGRGLGLAAVREQAESTGGHAVAFLRTDPPCSSKTLVFQIELCLKVQAPAA
jgi:HPt (histidine-containing phosphotransfer) domain-containing protein